MSEPQQASSSDQEKVYHLQANEHIKLSLNDATIEIQAQPEGGCRIQVEDSSAKKSTGNLRKKIKPLINKLSPIWASMTRQREVNWKKNLPLILTVLCLILYLSTRLIGLREYPVYFFTDEAVQTLLAEDLVTNDFRDAHGEILPTFFFNGYQYNLGPSVYLQVIPYMLFGRVLEVNRGISVLATSFSALFLFLIAKRVFKMKLPWLLILLLSITPVWFLHSRTSFETSLAFMFYSGFIYYYLSYRAGKSKHLFGAILMAALAFYTYSPVRFVVLGNALVFFLIDIRYHLKNKRLILYGVGFGILMTIPFIRFQVQNPGANLEHLRILGSYWIQDISIFAKVGIYLKEYISSFSLGYWFFSQMGELSRHRMGHYAYVPIWMLPLVLGGMLISIWRCKDTKYRDVLIFFVLAPMGGAVVARGITRILILVIPFLLFSGMALDWLIVYLQKRFKSANVLLSVGLIAILGWANIYLLTDALENGATWDTDYGMAGLQYGSIQLADKIPEYMDREDNPVQLLVSPTWANGTDMVMRFFFGTPLPFAMGNIDTYINNYVPIPDDLLIVMTKEEVERMYESNKFDQIEIVDRIAFPNGQTGFSFVSLKYIDAIEDVFAEEVAARKILQVEELPISGVPAAVSYSYLDMGQINDIFDHDDASMIRTMEANPMVIQVHYNHPTDLERCTVRIGGTASTMDLELYNDEQTMIGQYHIELEETAAPRIIDFEIIPQDDVTEVHFILFNTYDVEPAHVHLWEFTCTRQAE
ncbi:MAG: glycosyltransferase family 39 protein [Anaerolineaceae bacterium]|nr:glycosyltransferase family 39 protein [Anaerolineaceae bacterium]